MPARGQSSLLEDACIPSLVFHVTPFSSGGLSSFHTLNLSHFSLCFISLTPTGESFLLLRAHWLEWAHWDNLGSCLYIERETHTHTQTHRHRHTHTHTILIRSAQSLLSCKVTYAQLPGIRAWTSLWDCSTSITRAYHREYSCQFWVGFFFLLAFIFLFDHQLKLVTLLL